MRVLWLGRWCRLVVVPRWNVKFSLSRRLFLSVRGMNNIIIPPNADGFWLYYTLETTRRRRNTPFLIITVVNMTEFSIQYWYGKRRVSSPPKIIFHGQWVFEFPSAGINIIMATNMLNLKHQDKRTCVISTIWHMVGWIFTLMPKLKLSLLPEWSLRWAIFVLTDSFIFRMYIEKRSFTYYSRYHTLYRQDGTWVAWVMCW